MITPDAGVDFHALRIAGLRRTDVRGALDAVAGVQPAVGAPLEAIGRGMPDRVFVDAVEHDLRRTIGNVVAVAIGNEQQLRQVQHPHAAEADLDAGGFAALIPEHGAAIVLAVAVGVFENDDAVLEFRVPAAEVVAGPGVVFQHPQSAALVGGDGDRVLHVGFGGEDLQLEARRKFGGPGHFVRRTRRGCRLFRIVGRRKIGGGRRRGEHGQQAQRGEHSTDEHRESPAGSCKAEPEG